MATTIKLKNGSGAPLAGDLVQGEPALDLTNKRLYTEDSGGTVIEVGTNPGTDVTFADNRKAIFGAGSDLEIYHNATDSVIADVGTGNLKILANDLRINNADSSKSYITGFNGAQVYLYHNGSPKLETTATGIDVTGDVNSDSVTTGTFTSTGIDDNATSTAITIDAGGSVLIGKTTPTDLHNTWNHLIIGEKGAIISENGAGGIDGITVADNAYIDADTGSYAYQTTAAASKITQTGGVITFGNAASGTAGTALTLTERMRIDSSGNLLVGKDAIDSNVAGFEVDSDGKIAATRDGSQVAIFNRLTSDGDIAVFRKDGTNVGTIGSNSSNLQVNGTGAIELQENGTTRAYVDSTGIHPWADNTYDLGLSSARWKDLYLSGGAYLGGTAAANHLDDYEEGVHTTTVTAGSGTPTISSAEDSVGYTVIGDSVFITGQLGTINCSGCSGTLSVTMPFVTKTNTERSDYYQFIAWTGESSIAYFVLSQNGGGSSTFFVNAIKTDGSYDANVSTLMASAGTFNLNIVGGTYKKS